MFDLLIQQQQIYFAPKSDDVFMALRSFLLGLFPSMTVIKGLSNNIAMPVGGFIAMTPLFQKRLATNLNTYSDFGGVNGNTQTMTQSTIYTIQLDCFGVDSANTAATITTAFRSEYAVLAMTPNCTPLHADDPKQMPLIDAESQYEQRWTVTALLEYEPAVTIPMQFFNKATVTTIPVNA
jgi:hypothetical protein